jgi:signal transduction histidine kinase
MDKMKHPWQDLSLKKSLVSYVVIFAILALMLCAITFAWCNNTVENIRASYPPSGEKYYLTNEKGEQLGEGGYIGTELMPMSERDKRLVSIFEILPIAVTPIYSALCILAAALLFYRNKLKRPLAELRTASEKISNNDLDFSIKYKSKDELGQLCSSFEIMRTTLASNFSKMWRQVEERKQLNAAFAHDLRTPLTVLKGYNEMLQVSANAGTRETAVTMGKHIARLERYVSSMSNLQRLEDTQPQCKMTSWQGFFSSLNESADILCSQKGKKLYIHNKTTSSQLFLDTELISQVSNNLISNAVRYAKTSVTILLDEKNSGLLLSVSDDGKGFDESSLRKATNPYFTKEENHSEHFGLGLYICKVLCEHHGGYLHIENTPDGAKVTAFFKSHDL